MKKTTWIVRTAVCLALLLVLQVATKSLGQFVTGSCVNLVLAMAALSGGLWSGVAVAVALAVLRVCARHRPGLFAAGPLRRAGQRGVRGPVCAAGRKMADGEATGRLGQHGAGRRVQAGGIVCGAGEARRADDRPAAKLTAVTAAFTWPQLVTALIGGVLACLIAPPVRRALEK